LNIPAVTSKGIRIDIAALYPAVYRDVAPIAFTAIIRSGTSSNGTIVAPNQSISNIQLDISSFS